MKKNKTNRQKLKRILTICTTGIPGNKHKDKGENPDNSIYLERGNNWQEPYASPHRAHSHIFLSIYGIFIHISICGLA